MTIPEQISDDLDEIFHEFRSALHLIEYRRESEQPFSESDIEFITERSYNPAIIQKKLNQYNRWVRQKRIPSELKSKELNWDELDW